jgi:hypothetical protein
VKSARSERTERAAVGFPLTASSLHTRALATLPPTTRRSAAPRRAAFGVLAKAGVVRRLRDRVAHRCRLRSVDASSAPAVIAVVVEAPVPAVRALAVVGDDVVEVVAARPVLPGRGPRGRNSPRRKIDPSNGQRSLRAAADRAARIAADRCCGRRSRKKQCTGQKGWSGEQGARRAAHLSSQQSGARLFISQDTKSGPEVRRAGCAFVHPADGPSASAYRLSAELRPTHVPCSAQAAL